MRATKGTGGGPVRVRELVVGGFWVMALLAAAIVTNRAPMDGSGNATPWIRWLPWGHHRKGRPDG